ncbi:MAG: response regulator [Desulfovibrionaceae bacterium]|nr:response regulator [Desulfovibrionaceae bacterium]
MTTSNDNNSELILIVDDEVDICWSLEYILNKNNFCTAIATSARDALLTLRKQRFHLVFIDAKLPDIDGLELARQIRLIDPHISIVMVSGYFYEDDVLVQQAIGQGLISAFISKPFLQEEIVRVLDSPFKKASSVFMNKAQS